MKYYGGFTHPSFHSRVKSSAYYAIIASARGGGRDAKCRCIIINVNERSGIPARKLICDTISNTEGEGGEEEEAPLLTLHQ